MEAAQGNRSALVEVPHARSQAAASAPRGLAASSEPAEPAPLPLPDRRNPDVAYQAALEYLYGRSAIPRTPAEIRADHPRKVPRLRRLLALWSNPHHAYDSLLIAGTKGKGSTAAMLAAILRAAGRRVGRYTQPHLVSYRERTWVDGACIPPAAVIALVAEVRGLVDEAERRWPELGAYTTFDIGTALSLAHFARQGVDVAVVEVGVGGAHDATNALEPVASVITAISADHLATLGPTLAHVAQEKAGVLRPGRPAVIGPQTAAVRRVLARIVAERAVPAAWVGADWTWQPATDRPAAGRFTVTGPEVSYPGLSLPLLGRHQRENAAVAIATAHRLAAGALAPQTVAAGLAAVSWPARIQVVPASPPCVIDGAHNAASAASLRNTLEECFPAQPVVLVLGCSADKSLADVARELVPAAHAVVVTQARHPRAAPARDVAAAVAAAGGRATVASDAAGALCEAADRCPPQGLVVVAGSVFLAGEALDALACVCRADAC